MSAQNDWINIAMSHHLYYPPDIKFLQDSSSKSTCSLILSNLKSLQLPDPVSPYSLPFRKKGNSMKLSMN